MAEEQMVHYGDIPPAVGVLMVPRLLEVAQPKMLMQRWAQVTVLPRRRGDSVAWTRYERFAAAAAALADGVNPAAQPMRKRTITAAVAFYGAVTRLTDACYDLHPDNPLDVAIQLSGDQMALTEEVLTLAGCKASANRHFANGVAARANVKNVVSAGDFARVERGFNRANVDKINKAIAPTAGSNTWPIPETFVAIVHTDCSSDIRNCRKFRPVEQYADPAKRFEMEIGAVGRFRVFETNLLEPWRAAGATTADMLSNEEVPAADGAAADVYPILCLGKNAYGVVRLQSAKSAQVKVLQPGVARHGDELGRKGSVGWGFWYAFAILNEDALAVLEVAVSAAPEE
jgi:N4-gp56 family major capsid protein